jgi:uncharacterized FAD-dependent dehydrogenase
VEYQFPKCGQEAVRDRIVVIGMGPAGLFCAYYLAKAGFPVLVLERGKCVEERTKDVLSFWESGRLHTQSNVQFGEGGAGTFSDGKLNTVVKDKDGRNAQVLRTFVAFGAPEKITYDAKPHIGTDVLTKIVRNMREEIIRLGGEVRFESCMTQISIEEGCVRAICVNGAEWISCSQVVLAIGHSARDTFEMLYEKEVPMEQKPFAVGLRVEHPQVDINRSQYGPEDAGALGAAPYKVIGKGQNGRAVYSFCMCPGGYVVNASSEEGYTAVNGMSYSGRDGNNANSAIVVAVGPDDFGSEHPLAGMYFQRDLEKKAFALGEGKIPVQRYGEFRAQVLRNRADDCQDDRNTFAGAGACAGADADAGASVFQPQCKGAYKWANVSEILPRECNEAFVDGMESFGRQIQGFDRPDAILSGVESRTSSPVRILRDISLESEIKGLYPCGEGAGYAGGITSAAMDGLRVAEAIARRYCN